MHGGRARRAGILDPRRALEAQIGRGLQHQRRGEILRGEAGVEMAEHDLIDVLGSNAGVGKRAVGDPRHQALDRFTFELAERRVRPANDACRHFRSSLCTAAEIWSLLLGLSHPDHSHGAA